MENNKIINSLKNLITYSYRGFYATMCFIFRRKGKIDEMFAIDSDNQINMNSNDAFVKRDNSVPDDSHEELYDKISFKYKAKKSDGKIITGTFDAYNIEQAKRYLANNELEVLEIAPRKKFDIDISFGNPISMDDLAFALTQLSTYIRAGMTLVNSVRILAKQADKPAKRKIYDMIVYDLLSGDDFSKALSKQPKVFPKLLINMSKSAELTGDLPNVLDEMAEYYTSITKTRKEIKSAMTYPMIVMIFAILVVAFVLIWIVPQYTSMFQGFGAELPKITLITISISDFLRKNLIGVVIMIIIVLFLYIYLFRNVRSFRKIMQNVYLHIPVLKNIIMYSEVSMFSRTFASLINHGVYITDSMDVLMNVSENEIYRGVIIETIKNLNAGGKISDAFKDNWAIPVVAYEMIVTGENTGELGTMLEKVADYYESLHRNSVSAIKSLIEPFLIVFLAGSVGLIILAVILPMFDMYSVIG